MSHEQHDAAYSGQRVEWSRYGQYQSEIGMVRARTVQVNLKISSLACKGARNHISTHGQIRVNSLVHVQGGSYGTRTA